MRRRLENQFSGALLQEHLLQGAILDNQRDPFLHRLNGICDTVGTGPEKFYDHEYAYTLSNATDSVTLRLRKAVDHPESPHHIRYVGATDFGDRHRISSMRSYIDIPVSDDASDFLCELGFKLDHEYAAKGYVFRKGIMKIVVSKIYKIPNTNKPDELLPLGKSYAVEISILTPRSTQHQALHKDMKLFSEQLYPYIKLEKVDHQMLEREYRNPTTKSPNSNSENSKSPT